MISSAMNYYNTTLYEQTEEVVNIQTPVFFILETLGAFLIFIYMYFICQTVFKNTIIYRI